MHTFKYSLLSKLIYRFGNIPVTILLLINLYISLINIFHNWYLLFPFLINLIIIYFLNRFYLRSYRTFPFIINADNEKIICKDFFLSKKVIEIKYSEITNIDGNIFSGNLARPLYIIDSKKGIKIGVYNHIRNFNKMLTIILSNVTNDLYKELLNRINELKEVKSERIFKRELKSKKPIR
ncbi:hypothetical protein ACFLS9_01135 [Bacteroidota bacterium]